MKLYKNKYRINSIRLKDWDYSSYGYYFVTICTKDKECFFGNINDGKVSLSDIGIIANNNWIRIPEHLKNANLDEFKVMPNHIHGIIIIENQKYGEEIRKGVSYNKSTINKFSKPIKGSLSIIINQFKSSLTRWCHKNGNYDFSWQSKFYDHIIRNEKSLQKIREYIVNNPLKWELDEYNPKNLSL